MTPRWISIALLALPLLCWASGAEAACTGSGTAWSCPAGATPTDVQSAINSAADGATITFANGSYPWTTYAEFNPTKGATLICATVGGCNITANGIRFGIINGTWAAPVTKLFRISGFHFTGSAGDTGMIWFRCGNTSCGFNALTQIRVDHNTFDDPNTTFGDRVVQFGQNQRSGRWYGVIDHNTFNQTTPSISVNILGCCSDPNPPPTPLGTVNNMFIEDNVIIDGSINDTSGGAYCIDGWAENNMVFRHNTVTNCVVGNHANYAAGGLQNYEVYNNTFIVNSGASGILTGCGRCYHNQGAGLVHMFNNVWNGNGSHSGIAMSVMDYRDSGYLAGVAGNTVVCDGTQTGQFLDAGVPIIDGNRTPVASYRGYPCWHAPFRTFPEIAGSPAGGYLYPGYEWNNTWADDGSQVPWGYEDLGGASDYTSVHAVENRDYFNAVSTSAQTSPTSPFNGSTGMGFGTLANRPMTCSRALTDAGDAGYGGVGYFATDDGPMGTLYHCGATNTWTVEYRPYIYPHPLVGGGGQPSITSIPGSSGSLNQPFSYTITASNNPTSFNATGLPPGLSVNTTTGVISGTPTTPGTYSVTISATNAAGTSYAVLTLTIAASAASITIGETNVLSSDDSGNANLLPAQTASLSQTATLQSLSFYVTQAAGKLRLGVYDATGAGGNPGNKLAETNEITPAAGWNTANVIAPVTLKAGNYWLAYLPSDNGLHFSLGQGAGMSEVYKSYTYGIMPCPFGTPTAAAAPYHWSFYGTLTTQ